MTTSSEARRRATGTLAAALGSSLLCTQPALADDAWHPARAPLMTRWAKHVSPKNALPEYPRPQMVRKDWLNLNGLWDYAVIDSGIVPDTSSSKNNARVMGSPAFLSGEGPSGKGAFSFDGQNDYLVIPRVVQDDFTISLWIKTTQTGPVGNWSGAIGLVDGECPGVTDDFGTALVGDKFALGIGNPDITLTSKTAVNDGKWHHVAAVRTRSTGAMQVYVDGKLEATATGCTHSLTVPGRLTIGQIQTGGHRFDGSMADVHIYSRPLTAGEITKLSRPAEHSATNEIGQLTGLVGRWQLDNAWIKPQTQITYTGRILVPFPIESALSGVMKPFLPGQNLWYRRTFSTPDRWNGKRILLHFGAVDFDSTVWLEPVPKTSITGLKITPDIDASLVRLVVNCDNAHDGDRIEVEALSNGSILSWRRESRVRRCCFPSKAPTSGRRTIRSFTASKCGLSAVRDMPNPKWTTWKVTSACERSHWAKTVMEQRGCS